ncbi:DUF3558 domain-containing protein [Streptomyces sp. NPDC056144]|uniref:DUF3558 domain-containing protein n=1 Tax=unclassified Streptomyces TaxID=2593676 RepID=UPI0035DFB76E
MQRERYAPGRAGSAARAAAVLTSALGLGLGLALTGCSAGSPADKASIDAKAGGATVPLAPPGRYTTLFEACGAVPQAMLKDLLPGAEALPDPERAKAYRGSPAVTYDTDRRVGCTWKADSPELSHRLVLDIERVVSYDPAVSDDARAQEVYLRKQLAAGIPVPPTTPPSPTGGTGSPSPTGKTPGTTSPTTPAAPASTSASAITAAATSPTNTPGGPGPTDTADTTSPSADATPDPDTTGLEPRVLDGLGDIAYVDDRLTTVGANSLQRAVSVVFRTSNVIVTIAYREQTAGSPEGPDSEELQAKAQKLARRLAERLEE